MNIVKLKDILMPGNNLMAEFFNSRLKGKYAYWIQMRYIFPLDSLDYKTYIKYEQLDHVHFLGPDILPHIDLYSDDSCMMDFARIYIDISATEEANNIYEYTTANDYVADPDIDINTLRNFRTWLASELLKFNTGIDGNYVGKYTDNQIHMLEYYKGGMFNEVVKRLSDFGSSNYITSSVSTGCGCCNNNLSSLYNISNIDMCDALSIYRKNVHNLMVQTFEDIEFWKQFNPDFIKVFKKYIDNILKTKMVITSKYETVPFSECNCNYEQKTTVNEDILKRLSYSLEYIINKDFSGHVNYIHDALHAWAEYLYDNMSWEINNN